MKNAAIVLAVFVLIGLIGYFCVRIYKSIRSQKEIDALFASPNRGRGFIIRVLRAAYGNKVITGPVITVKGYAPATCDALIVSRGGITVLSVLPNIGKLDNPPSGDWVYYDRFGNCTAVENPFERNAYVIEVIKNRLRKEGFVNISFQSYAVISNSRAVMPKYFPTGMINENNMLGELGGIMMDKQLSHTERKDVQASCESFCKRKVRTAPNKNNNMQ